MNLTSEVEMSLSFCYPRPPPTQDVIEVGKCNCTKLRLFIMVRRGLANGAEWLSW
jgi:hypothetical protein